MRGAWAARAAEAHFTIAPRRPFRLCLQVPQQAVEGFLILIVILPVAEIWNEVLANLAGRVDANVAIEAFPIAKIFVTD